MAEQLIDGLARPFEVERFPNETRRALLEFLEAKAEGQEPVIAEEPPREAPVVDLMAALKASLAAVGGGAEQGGDGAEQEATRREVAGSGSKGKGKGGTGPKEGRRAAAGDSGDEAAEAGRRRKAS